LTRATRQRENRRTALLPLHISGTYLEACNCEAICPCHSVGGRPGGPSSYGQCFGALSWHVRGDPCLFLVRGHLAEDSVLFQQAAELVGILGQVSRVDRSAGVRQADPGGNNGTVSGLSSENSFTATPWAAKCSMACAGRVLAMPQAVGRMEAPYRRPRCGRRIPGLSPGGEPTRRWLALPGCPVKSQGVLCIGRAQEKARYRPGGQINRFVKIDGG